jgi:cyclic di-GMP phosphodiesterase
MRVEDLRSLRDRLQRAADPDGALHAFHSELARPLGAVALSLLRREPGDPGFHSAALVGLNSGYVEKHETSELGPRCWAAEVVESRSSRFIVDVRRDSRWVAPRSTFGPGSVLLVPLMSGESCLGVLAAYWHTPPAQSSLLWVEAAAPLLAARLKDLAGGTAAAQILVIEDDVPTARLLELTLSTKGTVRLAFSVHQGLAEAQRYPPDLAVIDMVLPDGSGVDVARELRRMGDTRLLFLSGVDVSDVPLGAADGYVQKPYHPRELLSVVEDLLGGRKVSPRPANGPEDLIERYAFDLASVIVDERSARTALEEANLRVVQALAAAVEARDTTTGAHLHRVRTYACALAEAIAPELLSDHSFEYGCLLHDVGKIGIPDSVLRKANRFSTDEYDLMRTHVTIGEQLVQGIPAFEEARRIISSHHERWDGTGYPRGLKGRQIALGARIFSVVDAFDAMTSDRPYRQRMGLEQARREVARHSGTQFDPEIVSTFLGLRANDLGFSLIA